MTIRIHPSQRGFSLVELMVGVTVALVGLLIITGILVNSSRQKQTTSSGSDAQTAGSIGSYLIERDVRMAGYGVNFASLLGCTIHGYDSASSPARNFTFVDVPIVITAGTATTSDQITITYGSSDTGLNAPNLVQNNNGSNANYKVDNRFGFHEGNLIVVSEDGVDSDGDGVDDCTLAEVTGVPGTPGQSDNIIHNSGNYTDAAGNNVTARYNKPSGLGIAYTTKAKVYNLGNLPTNKIYAVSNGELTALDTFLATAPSSVAENVIFLRAQYGKDTNSDGTVDTFDQTTPTTVAGWKQVVAVRFAVVARSHNREGELVTATPLTLLPAITLPGGTNLAAQTLTLSDEERHYRYKVYTAFVPLRNQIWVPE